MGEQPANAVKAAEEKLHDEQLDWEDFCADKAELEEPVDESDRWVNIQRWVIEDLLDAARTEGRGEGQPVAWAYEYTNHLKGDRAPGGWLRAVAFEAPTRARVNAGFARNVQPLYASPIREPEISREAMSRDEAREFVRSVAMSLPPSDFGSTRAINAMADAILNLAPVGGRGEVSASDRAFVRHLIREMRSAIADDPNDATITTGPLDPDILERVLNVALGEPLPPPPQEQGGMK